MRNIIAKSHLAALQSSFLFLLATVFSKTFERMYNRRTQTKFWMSAYLTL